MAMPSEYPAENRTTDLVEDTAGFVPDATASKRQAAPMIGLEKPRAVQKHCRK
jgi:hypothetical protein